MLTLLWARLPVFRSRSVWAFSYAAPCCVCEDISQAPFTRRHVTSIVTGDDLVSRFGLATFRELQGAMMAMSALVPPGGATKSTLDEKREALGGLPGEPDKLFCAGKVWWLNSREFEPHPIVEIDPVQELDKIELFPGLFAVHLPRSYLDTLAKLDESSL